MKWHNQPNMRGDGKAITNVPSLCVGGVSKNSKTKRKNQRIVRILNPTVKNEMSQPTQHGMSIGKLPRTYQNFSEPNRRNVRPCMMVATSNSTDLIRPLQQIRQQQKSTISNNRTVTPTRNATTPPIRAAFVDPLYSTSSGWSMHCIVSLL